MVFHDLGNLGFADIGKVLILRLRIPWDEFNHRFEKQLKTLSPHALELIRSALLESQDPHLLMEENELDSFFDALQPITARMPSPPGHIRMRKHDPSIIEVPRIRNVKSFTLKEETLPVPPEIKTPRYARISSLYNTLLDIIYEFCNLRWEETPPAYRDQKLMFLKSNIDRTQKIIREIHALQADQIEDFWRQILDALVKLQAKMESPWWQPLINILSPTLPTGVVAFFALCVKEKILNSKEPYIKEYWAFQTAVGTNYPPEQLEQIFDDIAFKQQLFVVSIRSPSPSYPPSPEKWSIVVVNHRWIAQTINGRKDFKYKVIGQEIPYTALETSFRMVGPQHSYASILKTLSQRRLLSKPLDYTETSLIIIGKPYMTMGSSLRIIIGIVAGLLSIYISLSRIFPPTP